MPPLKDRSGDVSLLVDKFLESINSENKTEPGYKHKKISASAKNILIQHPWPGNVRELQNTLTRAAVWSLDEELTDDDIREALFPIPGDIKAEDAIFKQVFRERDQHPGNS